MAALYEDILRSERLFDATRLPFWLRVSLTIIVRNNSIINRRGFSFSPYRATVVENLIMVNCLYAVVVFTLLLFIWL